MLCAEQHAFSQEYRAAVHNYHAAIRLPVVLIDRSATNSDFNLAHLKTKAARGLSEVALAALEHHQAEHGC
jgi:ABC-type branched-subunit amino acid transport system substrate-binding protein